LKWQIKERQTEKLTERSMEPYKMKRVILANVVKLELLKTPSSKHKQDQKVQKASSRTEKAISLFGYNRERRGV